MNFCKDLLNVRTQTQNNFVYGELGRTTLLAKRSLSVIRYWMKIVQMETIRYVKIVYDQLYCDLEDNPNFKSWAYMVKHLLQALGFNHVWMYQGVGDVDVFMFSVKQRITDIFIQKWISELSDSTRARSYILFADFKLQSYLSDVNIVKYRTALSRIRVSAHRLEIETGRWHKPVAIPHCDRKCLACNLLEDEFHFILECQLYKDLRKQYLKQYYYTAPNIPKFVALFQSQNVTVNRNLAIYVYKAMELRERYVLYYG